MLAFAFRNTRLCLLAGIWVGATLIVGGNPLTGLFWVGYEGSLCHALLDRLWLEILVFIFGLVETVGIMSRMGGVAGMLQAAARDRWSGPRSWALRRRCCWRAGSGCWAGAKGRLRATCPWPSACRPGPPW